MAMLPLVVPMLITAFSADGAISTPRPEALVPLRLMLPVVVLIFTAAYWPPTSSDRALNEPLELLMTLLLAVIVMLPAVLVTLTCEPTAELVPLPEAIKANDGVVPPEVLPLTLIVPPAVEFNTTEPVPLAAR